MKKLGFIALTLAALVATTAAVAQPVPLKPGLNEYRSKTWRDGVTHLMLYSCDNFDHNEGSTEPDDAGVCVAITCSGITIASRTGYNEQVRWHRRLPNGKDRVFDAQPAEVFDAKLSTYFDAQARRVSYDSFLSTMKLDGEGPTDYLRFSLPLMAAGAPHPAVYTFTITQKRVKAFRDWCTRQ